MSTKSTELPNCSMTNGLYLCWADNFLSSQERQARPGSFRTMGPGSSSHVQPCPFAQVWHTNTGLNFLSILCTHRRRLCTFHVFSTWKRLSSKYCSIKLSEAEQVFETWTQFSKVLWCHETCHKSIKWFAINTNKTYWNSGSSIAPALFQRLIFAIPGGRMISQPNTFWKDFWNRFEASLFIYWEMKPTTVN